MAGAVFLATPFRGTDAVQPASWLVTIKGIMGEDASDKLIQDLERRHDHVYQRTQNFARILYTHSATLPVCCFYETQKTDIYRGILPRTGYIVSYIYQYLQKSALTYIACYSIFCLHRWPYSTQP